MSIDVIFVFLLMWAAFILGFLTKGFLNNRFRDYSGTIVVDKDRLTEKTVYSLVLDDYPEKLEFKKEVIFKIKPGEQSLDRD